MARPIALLCTAFLFFSCDGGEDTLPTSETTDPSTTFEILVPDVDTGWPVDTDTESDTDTDTDSGGSD